MVCRMLLAKWCLIGLIDYPEVVLSISSCVLAPTLELVMLCSQLQLQYGSITWQDGQHANSQRIAVPQVTIMRPGKRPDALLRTKYISTLVAKYIRSSHPAVAQQRRSDQRVVVHTYGKVTWDDLQLVFRPSYVPHVE